MNKYLIFLDLDGTLLHSRNLITNYTKEKIKFLENQGHILVISTGRPFFSAIDIHKEIGLKNYFISDNGASITKPEDKNFNEIKKYLDKDDFYNSFNMLKPIIQSGVFNIGKELYTYNYDKRLAKYIITTPEMIRIEGDFNNYNDVPSGVLYTIKNEDKDIFENIVSKNFPNIHFRYWFDYDELSLYELSNINSTKGHAIKELIELLNWDPKLTIAFGDNVNDYEMLTSVNYGVAMKNARPELLTTSKYITKYTNQEDGVVKYLLEEFDILNK